jgi:hypothetical protein
MGFVDAARDQIEYLIIPGYNPHREEQVAQPAVTAPEIVPVYDETFLGWLQQQWDAFNNQRGTSDAGAEP